LTGADPPDGGGGRAGRPKLLPASPALPCYLIRLAATRGEAVWSTASRTGRSYAHLSFGKQEVPTMATGTIKKLVADRGFGFITAEDAKDYFFHRDGLDSSLDFDRLVGGERVEFDIETSPKGPRATRVRTA
jgi:CspA family cold shock protein